MTFDYLKDKSILVTGGTGSFGQKCITTLLTETEAKRIVIFSRDELKQSEMRLRIADPHGRMRFFIGDVRDEERLERAFCGIDFVIHAAALKQVPALEYNPFEAIKTNVLGTQNVITASLNTNVEKVLLISTDKAANPANLYGATKLCAERLMVSSHAYAASSRPAFGVVRYGNVLGSRGSIIQVIQEQRKSGVVTLTHADMTRFWITLEQGIHFVLTMLCGFQGGEIFVPKIPSMRVKDLMMAVAPECEMKITGIRAGEKLHEVLLTVEEARNAKEFVDHFVIMPASGADVYERYNHGRSLEEGFAYTSLTNREWLKPEEVQALL